jgi:hypothetical protein
MSLPVCPSAFIRFAVAMWSTSFTLRGRPNLVPLARDDARLQSVALLHQLALVLSKRPKYADHHASRSGRRVDAVRSRHQRHATVGQVLYGLQDVEHVAAQPVELPDDDRVPARR